MKLKFGMFILSFMVGCGVYEDYDDCDPTNLSDYCFEDRTVFVPQVMYTSNHVPYFVPHYTHEHVHVTKTYNHNTINITRKNKNGKVSSRKWSFSGGRSRGSFTSGSRRSRGSSYFRPSRSFSGRSRGRFGR